jgi:poly-gamma-glutamate capsule biosynthesis protein CapA/YwtB (metallophosphatase superfamily)
MRLALVGDVECVISDRVPSHLPNKTFQFRSDHKNAAVLKAAGIDAVSVANNHSLDFSENAMLDMLATLDAEGIGHAGAGATLEEAMRPALSMTRDGTRIGLLACTDNEPDWAAGPNTPGVWFVPPGPASAPPDTWSATAVPAPTGARCRHKCEVQRRLACPRPRP